jgi:hypothetical protein
MRNLALPAVLAVCLLNGCRTAVPKTVAAHAPPVAVRNNSYSLLHQLLDEQKDVKWLGVIKWEDSEVKPLIKKIAATSKTDAEILEGFAKSDPSLSLDATDLPPAEVAARDEIAASKKDALLGRKGDAFELTLLLSQAEALNYAWHLAKVAAKNDADPNRVRALADIGNEMEQLYGQVFVLLRSRTTMPQKP